MFQQSQMFQSIRQHNEEWLLMQRKTNEYLETHSTISECYRLRDEYNVRKIIEDDWDFDEK